MKRRAKSSGSQTDASDAVDAPSIGPNASPDEVLDAAVELTFPASDPIAIRHAYDSAVKRERSHK